MNVSMEVPRTPQHDLVAMAAALRGALLQRVEQGIQASGMQSYYFYVIAKRLTFAGPMEASELVEQLRLDARTVSENLQAMQEQGMVRSDGDAWIATDAGRKALVAANESGGKVLNEIRNAIGPGACDELVAGMRDALTALRKIA